LNWTRLGGSFHLRGGVTAWVTDVMPRARPKRSGLDTVPLRSDLHDETGLCFRNPVIDSPCETSVMAGGHA
jgi:hypothetical protein